jgi:hypothetical protein
VEDLELCSHPGVGPLLPQPRSHCYGLPQPWLPPSRWACLPACRVNWLMQDPNYAPVDIRCRSTRLYQS